MRSFKRTMISLALRCSAQEIESFRLVDSFLERRLHSVSTLDSLLLLPVAASISTDEDEDAADEETEEAIVGLKACFSVTFKILFY